MGIGALGPARFRIFIDMGYDTWGTRQRYTEAFRGSRDQAERRERLLKAVRHGLDADFTNLVLAEWLTLVHISAHERVGEVDDPARPGGAAQAVHGGQVGRRRAQDVKGEHGMNRRRYLSLILAVTALLACGGKDVTAGTVISRDYEPAYDSPGTTCVAYDPKTFLCTMSMVTVNHYDAVWTLCLRDDTEDKPVGERSIGCVSVTQADYDHYSVGEHYPESQR